MSRDTDLLRRLRSKGLHVVEVAGWQTRGLDDLDVQCTVNHHTAAPRRGNAPSLGIVINGRGGSAPVPGPLCNVLKARDQTCYLVAAGKSNNAGIGAWRGVTGNRHTFGLENENTGLGDEPWTEADLDTMARIHAAFMETHFTDVGMVCQHWEWTTRKIDAWDRTHFNVAIFRDRIHRYLGYKPPPPKPPPREGLFMHLTEAEEREILVAARFLMGDAKGDNPKLGTANERELEALKRIETKIGSNK